MDVPKHLPESLTSNFLHYPLKRPSQQEGEKPRLISNKHGPPASNLSLLLMLRSSEASIELIKQFYDAGSEVRTGLRAVKFTSSSTLINAVL